MKTSLYILNLSDREHRLAPDPQWLLQGKEIDSLADLPDDTDEGVVLYVLGHGVRNGLVDGQGQIINELAIAKAIQEARPTKPMLIIWDACFARGMEKIGGGNGTTGTNGWRSNIIHIFCCDEFERTWVRPGAKTTDPAVSVFSKELAKAISGLPAGGSFALLETNLQSQYDGIQKPTIVPNPPRKTAEVHAPPPVRTTFTPDDFELKKLLTPPPERARPTPHGPPGASVESN